MEMDQAAYDMIKVYVAQTQSAVKISETVCEHSNRNELTGDDIICGLIYRLMTPMTDTEMAECMNQADNLMNDNSSSEEEEEEINEKELLDNSRWRKLTCNNCNCDICCTVRVCLLNYKDYEPNDILADRFKNSINETCDKYKLMTN